MRSGRGAALILAVLSGMAGGAMAQDGIVVDPAITEACLQVNAATPEACIGVAAAACMRGPGGGSNVGMGGCLWREAEMWDARLNMAYRALMDRHGAEQAEMARIGATVPSMTDALREMQRAWIPYRDAACAYERSTWGGGTGGGPAQSECIMQITARQALALEARLGAGYGME